MLETLATIYVGIIVAGIVLGIIGKIITGIIDLGSQP